MRRITKIAVAASILFVLLGLSAWLVPWGGQALAFTDVADTLSAIRSATWSMTTETERSGEKQTIHGKAMFQAPSRERLEMTVNGTVIHSVSDAEQGKGITVMPAEKMAVVFQVARDPAAATPASTFQRLRQIVSEAQSGKDTDIVSLGDDVLDGQAVTGFQIRLRGVEVNLWADRETALPVRAEYTTSADATALVVLDNFEVNVDLDDSLFSLEIPADYTVREEKIDTTQPPIAEDLAKSLRTVAMSNDNVFPPELRGENGMEGAMSGHFAKLIAENGGSLPQTDEAKELFSTYGRAMAFLLTLTDESDWKYVGGGVQLDTPNTPIFWYKPADAEQYRVIHADLSVSDMAASDLPQVE